MKKSILLLAFCSLCFFAANAAHAQPVSEADIFCNVGAEADSKSVSADDTDGIVKCRRWYAPVRYYYRPTYYRYYRPAYCYYRYYSPVYYSYFSWSTIWCFKGAGQGGAVLDSDPAQGSPLAAQGLRKGDIITAIDGAPLKNLSDLSNVTANSKITVYKGDNVKYAGNLLKNDDSQSTSGLEAVAAGNLLTKEQIRSGNYDMYKYNDRAAAPVLGIKAVENNGNGVKVTEVVDGLPGQKAGFEIGDTILEINGSKINGEQDYSNAIDCSGTVAQMKIVCGKTGQMIDTNITLNKY